MLMICWEHCGAQQTAGGAQLSQHRMRLLAQLIQLQQLKQQEQQQKCMQRYLQRSGRTSQPMVMLRQLQQQLETLLRCLAACAAWMICWGHCGERQTAEGAQPSQHLMLWLAQMIRQQQRLLLLHTELQWSSCLMAMLLLPKQQTLSACLAA
jgi:hypothetical protein